MRNIATFLATSQKLKQPRQQPQLFSSNLGLATRREKINLSDLFSRLFVKINLTDGKPKKFRIDFTTSATFLLALLNWFFKKKKNINRGVLG